LKMDHIIEYHDTTAAQASAGKNSYYLVFTTDSLANTEDFQFGINFLYTDV